ncbi:adenylate kinase [Mucilaginibacter sp. 21P]|uniref:AAA family ATPase n=1 Tax=Mucilaginibacter sp. 21P TaxID=2778902 RepID=UPI001C599816|nr:AAA family ATPase [Mucilaginibacter sp. 21P]QXV67244.1 adenylate kinase [Mucilaginibacter sp. 21P]
MKIHIMGASCAGSTTLGKALASRLAYPYFDTDNYFWLPSDIPYTQKREPAERKAMLLADFEENENAIVGGSLVSWDDSWLTKFDLVVFLRIPHGVRMQRLDAREVERYGDQIYTNPVRVQLYKDFREWAKGYDDNTTNGRNLNVHLQWLDRFQCPILKIEGDTTVEERIDRVLKAIKQLR